MRKISLYGLMSIFSLSILFHLLVLMHIIPSTIVWGGRIEHEQELLRLELISMGVNALFLIFVLMLDGIIKVAINPKFARVLLWTMSIVFILNTIGNCMAKSSIETMIFTPVTLLLSIFCLYLAVYFMKS